MHCGLKYENGTIVLLEYAFVLTLAIFQMLLTVFQTVSRYLENIGDISKKAVLVVPF